MRDAHAEAAPAGCAHRCRTTAPTQSRRAARGTPTRSHLDAVIGIPASTRWTRHRAAECDARRDARVAEAAARRACRRMSRTRGPEAQAHALGRVARRRRSKEARRLQAFTLGAFWVLPLQESSACLPGEVWNRGRPHLRLNIRYITYSTRRETHSAPTTQRTPRTRQSKASPRPSFSHDLS